MCDVYCFLLHDILNVNACRCNWFQLEDCTRVGETTKRHAPVKVSVNHQKVVAMAAGGEHTAAITDSGELWTWGENGHGQLGVGDTTNRHGPVKVSVSHQKVVAVAAGYWHSAAITESGELWTWGYNGHGQLGVGDTKKRHAPIKVSVNGQKIVAVAARRYHTAVITASGELWTWGRQWSWPAWPWGHRESPCPDQGERERPEDCGRGCKRISQYCDHGLSRGVDLGLQWSWPAWRRGRRESPWPGQGECEPILWISCTSSCSCTARHPL